MSHKTKAGIIFKLDGWLKADPERRIEIWASEKTTYMDVHCADRNYYFINSTLEGAITRLLEDLA